MPRWFSDRYPGPPVCRDPWRVEAFENGLLHAARRDPERDSGGSSYWSGRSDMAVVRSLRDGRQRSVSVRLLTLHEDLGLTKGQLLPDAARPAVLPLPAPRARACCSAAARRLTILTCGSTG